MKHVRTMLILAAPVVVAALVGDRSWTSFGDFSAVVLAKEFSVAATTTGTSNREISSQSVNAESADVRLEPFHTKSAAIPDGTHYWKKWRRVAIDLPDELATVAACSEKRCSPAARKFRKIMNKALQHKDRSRLDQVNRAVNHAIESQTDTRNHGIPDHWSTAFETLGSGKGDCEDYAITKYALLRAMNWPKNDLRLVVVYFITAREYHAILAAHLEHHWLILDNLTDAIKVDVTLRRIYHPLLFVDESPAVHLLAHASPADKARLAELNSLD